MIGEIGGPQEAEAAEWVSEEHEEAGGRLRRRPHAPKGRRMGHAGAIISGEGDSAAEKSKIMEGFGLTVAPSPASSARRWPR